MDLISLFKAETKVNRWDIALLLLRVVAGFTMFKGHGLGKFERLIGDDPIKFGDPLGIGSVPTFVLAVFAEALCSLLIISGLFTRLASIPLIGTMATAVFLVHFNDPFNRIELPSIYLAVFLFLLLCGAGKYSLDNLFFKRT